MICGAEVKVRDKAGQERLNTVMDGRQTQRMAQGLLLSAHGVWAANKICIFELVQR